MPPGVISRTLSVTFRSHVFFLTNVIGQPQEAQT
jgi:hypothetical protein